MRDSRFGRGDGIERANTSSDGPIWERDWISIAIGLTYAPHVLTAGDGTPAPRWKATSHLRMTHGKSCIRVEHMHSNFGYRMRRVGKIVLSRTGNCLDKKYVGRRRNTPTSRLAYYLAQYSLYDRRVKHLYVAVVAPGPQRRRSSGRAHTVAHTACALRT